MEALHTLQRGILRQLQALWRMPLDLLYSTGRLLLEAVYLEFRNQDMEESASVGK